MTGLVMCEPSLSLAWLGPKPQPGSDKYTNNWIYCVENQYGPTTQIEYGTGKTFVTQHTCSALTPLNRRTGGRTQKFCSVIAWYSETWSDALNYDGGRWINDTHRGEWKMEGTLYSNWWHVHVNKQILYEARTGLLQNLQTVNVTKVQFQI